LLVYNGSCRHVFDQNQRETQGCGNTEQASPINVVSTCRCSGPRQCLALRRKRNQSKIEVFTALTCLGHVSRRYGIPQEIQVAGLDAGLDAGRRLTSAVQHALMAAETCHCWVS